MRIVSQDKTIDVPYGRATLYIGAFRETHRIYASFGFNDNEDVVLGTYSKERCIEIMQEIRDAAQVIINIQEVSNEDINLLKRELRNVSIIQSAQNESKIQICGETYFYMPEE